MVINFYDSGHLDPFSEGDVISVFSYNRVIELV